VACWERVWWLRSGAKGTVRKAHLRLARVAVTESGRSTLPKPVARVPMAGRRCRVIVLHRRATEIAALTVIVRPLIRHDMMAVVAQVKVVLRAIMKGRPAVQPRPERPVFLGLRRMADQADRPD
jgi:hypothetical protein